MYVTSSVEFINTNNEQLVVHSHYKYSLNDTYIALGLFFCYKYNHFLVQFSSYYQLRITTSFKLIYRIDSNGYLFFL